MFQLEIHWHERFGINIGLQYKPKEKKKCYLISHQLWAGWQLQKSVVRKTIWDGNPAPDGNWLSQPAQQAALERKASKFSPDRSHVPVQMAGKREGDTGTIVLEWHSADTERRTLLKGEWGARGELIGRRGLGTREFNAQEVLLGDIRARSTLHPRLGEQWW